MPDHDSTLPPVSQSNVVAKKRARLSYIWIVPIVAALAGGWVAVTRIMDQGPKITIEFESAEGLDAGKTRIRNNGLDVGTIVGLRLAPDHKHVIATARMSPGTEGFLVKDTRFWVVKPRMTGLNISGLGTLISGHYIDLEIGQSREHARHFVALGNPPIVAADALGHFFVLKTPELGSIAEGTPLYFRRLQAGQVVAHELDESGEFVKITVFVNAPYDHFITSDTRFWHASGVDMSVSASGLHIQTESLMSILAGGVAFETPAAEAPAPPAGTNTVFNLCNNHTEAFQPPPRNPLTFTVIFKQQVRGLVVGAPVALNGITIGEVKAIRAQFDATTLEFEVPVTIMIDPLRYGVRFLDLPAGQQYIFDRRKAVDTMVSRGLRAQLKMGSLLSGALYVAIDFISDAPPATVDWSQQPPALPTLPGALEGIEGKIASVIRKIDQMEFKEISDDVRKTFGELDKTLASARGTFTNTDRLLGNASLLIEPNSVLDTQLGGMLEEMGGAARAMRLLADYLERHPEALIRGKNGEGK